MKYYKIDTGLINKVVGNIASDSMTEDYDFTTHNSVDNIKIVDKLNFIPNIKSIQILNRAKPMDIIYSVPIINSGIIISDKLLSIINEFKLPNELQMFKANAVHKLRHYSYNYFYCYKPMDKEYINYKNTSFFNTNSIGHEKIPIEVTSYQDSFRIREELNEIRRNLNTGSIHININKIEYDIFRLNNVDYGYFVSENLKNAIENSDCEGIEFTQLEYLGYVYQ